MVASKQATNKVIFVFDSKVAASVSMNFAPLTHSTCFVFIGNDTQLSHCSYMHS